MRPQTVRLILCSISSAFSSEILFLRCEVVDHAEHSVQNVRARTTILTAFNVVTDPQVVSRTSVNIACVLCVRACGHARIYACVPSFAVLGCLSLAPHAMSPPWRFVSSVLRYV